MGYGDSEIAAPWVYFIIREGRGIRELRRVRSQDRRKSRFWERFGRVAHPPSLPRLSPVTVAEKGNPKRKGRRRELARRLQIPCEPDFREKLAQTKADSQESRIQIA